MNLEHVYEMLDMGVSNPAGAVRDCLLSQRKLDPSWFDGATYYFEVVAYNNTGSEKTLELRSNESGTFGDTQMTTVAVSASTTYTRYRSAAFTPSTGEKTYNLRLPSYVTADYIRVSAARIVIVQVSPTKTRLQIPLISANYSTYTNLETSAAYVVQKTSLTNASVGTFGHFWYKDESKFATIAAGTPWTLEVVGCMAAGGPGYASLKQSAAANFVSDSQVTISALTPTLVSADFSNSATNFSDATSFILGYRSDGTNMCSIQGANLYVKLTSLWKAEVCLRYGRRRAGASAISFGHQRIKLNQDNYSGAVSELYFSEVTGYATDAGHPIDSWLCYAVNSASSTSGSVVTGTAIQTTGTSGTTASRQRSSSFTPPTNGYDIYARQELVGVGREEAGHYILIQLADSDPDTWKGLTVIRDVSS